VGKRASGRFTRHKTVNDIISRVFVAAGVLTSKEPVGFCRSDGKRPDGLTLIPWQGSMPLLWDVRVVSTLTDSYVSVTALRADASAELASVAWLSQ